MLISGDPKNQPSELYIEEELKFLSPRHTDAHKGCFGHVLVIGGDHGMGGAVRLAAEGAARVGAGLVSVITRAENITAINSARPEIMAYDNKNKNIENLLLKATIIILGSGLGQASWGQKLFKLIIPKIQEKIIVLDADGLNILATNKKNIIKNNWVLTPHPKEAARLLNLTVKQIQDDRVSAAINIQKKYGGICVLKGQGTLVCSENKIAVCTAGNPGMASGGMGDILSGIISGLLAQKMDLFHAASLGVLLHATAGDIAAEKDGALGMLAMDLLPITRKILNSHYSCPCHLQP